MSQQKKNIQTNSTGTFSHHQICVFYSFIFKFEKQRKSNYHTNWSEWITYIKRKKKFLKFEGLLFRLPINIINFGFTLNSQFSENTVDNKEWIKIKNWNLFNVIIKSSYPCVLVWYCKTSVCCSFCLMHFNCRSNIFYRYSSYH